MSKDRAFPTSSPSRRVSLTALAVLIVVLVASAAGAIGTHAVVRDQKSRLLKERAAEVGLVFTSAVGTLSNSLAADIGVLRVTGSSAASFQRAVAEELRRGKATQLTIALIRKGADGRYRVVAAGGPLLKTGQSITGDRAAAVAAALKEGSGARESTPQKAPLTVSTRLLGSGDHRAVGFALDAIGVRGVPDAVLYRETVLGRLSAGHQAGTAPFHEVNVVLYAVPRVETSQLLISTTGGDLPAAGSRFLVQSIGASPWLIGVRPKSSLVGGVATNAWWIVLLGGVGVALLLATVIEFAIRRRNAALTLYAAEHQQAETLQRSLLPTLPVLASVELAARYQAGGVGQQVGGDWFDAFPLTSGGVGFAIGDVIGHDLAAAAAMSQVRAALRAYAYEGDEPSAVVSRLDRLVSTFELTQLVSVVYGVLGPVAGDGTRSFRFANAGHLPPMLQNPDGSVEVLDGGASVVIGAPYFEPRAQAERRLVPGSTLLLFTDGLLEAPDLSLSETIPALAEAIARHDPLAGCDSLCELVLANRPNLTQRDDTALLAVRLRQPAPAEPAPPHREDVTDVAPHSESLDPRLSSPSRR